MTFEELEALQDNWDGDGADAPSPLVIFLAKKAFDALVPNLPPGVILEDLDADVCGGVVLTFTGSLPNRYAMLDVSNSGTHILVFMDYGEKTVETKAVKDLDESVTDWIVGHLK